MLNARTERVLLGVLVALAAFVAFAPALSNAFVFWDDFLYIRDNAGIHGLSPAHLRWMLTAATGGLWQPLTLLSLAVDYRLWNLDPWGYHLTNILLHAATATLFYALCLRLLEDAWAAALAALFFALHPLRVESVAWAVERKDVLSGALLLSCVLLRLRGKNAWALACYALSLSAKVIGTTLPLVLLILEVYPLRRLSPDPRRWLAGGERRVLRSLAPYVVLSAASLCAALATAHANGMLHDFSRTSVWWRVGQAVDGLLRYPCKTLWPFPLASYYPPAPWYGSLSFALWARAAAALGAAAATALAARRAPGIAAALSCYAVMFLPTSGLVQEGVLYSIFDRYTYLSCLPFAVLFGAAFARSRPGRAAAAACLFALAFASRAQCAVWRDTLTLWSRAQARVPSGFALSNLGMELSEAGRGVEALAALRAAVERYPDRWLGYSNLGVALARDGDDAQARAVWCRGLAVEDAPDLHAQLGASLANGGASELAEGVEHLRKAVARNPRFAPWRLALADALSRAGRDREAESEYAWAASFDDEPGQVENNWGLLLARQGLLDEAARHYRAALRLPGARAEADYNLGNVYLSRGREVDAERLFREALRLKPRLSGACVNLGNILGRRGRYAEAARLYRDALKTSPGQAEARANLAAVERLLLLRR